MKLFVVVGDDVAAGENVFQVLGEISVDRHDVFEVAVLGTIFYHQNLSISFDDGGFDLADFLVHQNFVRQFSVEDLLTDFGDTLGQRESVERGQPRAAWIFRRT